MYLFQPGVWSEGWGGSASCGGWRVWVPGWAQWSWRQRERGAVLAGSYLAALGVGVFAWGTWLGLALLVFAFGTHVVSVVDVVRQTAFPGFGRWMPIVSVSGGLAAALYAPALLVASLAAWPVTTSRGTDGYVVNRWAYRGAAPERGDWIWLWSSPWGEPRLGRVVAGPGERVGWDRRGLRVADDSAGLEPPDRGASPPDELVFEVPPDHLLVATGPPGSRTLVLVDRAQVQGRVWARLYPVWSRSLLRDGSS